MIRLKINNKNIQATGFRIFFNQLIFALSLTHNKRIISRIFRPAFSQKREKMFHICCLDVE